MSTHEEERDRCFKENIPKLIKHLTNFNETDENFARCKQFTISKLKYHKHPSINSHEIKRRINGFLERLAAENLGSYAEKFRKLFDDFTNDPIFDEHDQKDIQWGLVNFLFEVAQNPINELKRRVAETPKELNLLFEVKTDCEPKEIRDESIIDILKEDNYENRIHNLSNSESDLSDWTDSDDDEFGYGVSYQTPSIGKKPMDQKIEKEWKIVTVLEKPKRPPVYSVFDHSQSEQWISTHVQPQWWKNDKFQCDTKSSFSISNFAQLCHSLQFDAETEPTLSTASEYCLIREILWMFTVPSNCKFFEILNNTIQCKKHVSIPSVSQNTLRYFLETFTKNMTYCFQLRNFCNEILSPVKKIHKLPPQVYRAYAKCMAEFLKTIWDFITAKEISMINQEENNGERISVMALYNEMRPQFALLKMLYQIHSNAVLDYQDNPAHICSAHLLAQLHASIQNSSNKEETNIAFILYIKSLRVFLVIIDTWWIEGKLDDWHDEFILAEVHTEEDFEVRQFEKCRDKSFHIKSSVSAAIKNDEIISNLMEILLKSASSLKMLTALDRFGELKIENESKAGIFGENLYILFYNQIICDLKRINGAFSDNSPADADTSQVSEADLLIKNDFSRNKFEREILEMGDEFLLLTFKESLDVAEQLSIVGKNDENISKRDKSSTWRLYESLNASFNIILPFSNIITNALRSLLEKKFAVVNKFITRIYKDEFKVLYHLQNLRRILLLEASDLMSEFYVNLFEQIKSDDTVLNGYHLTVQLNAIICSRFTNAMFNVELIGDSKTFEDLDILNAINILKINYDVPSTLSNLINGENIAIYNKIFHLLLKTKWAIWVLDNLQFPDAFKNRLPYAKLSAQELIYRRLAIIRVWLTFSIKNIDIYLMSEVIQANAIKMDAAIAKADNLPMIISIHNNFLATIKYQCFQNEEQNNLLMGVMQFLNLISVLEVEWRTGGESSEIPDKLEQAYIQCHRFIANNLAKENYLNNNSHLDSLSAAFNCSIPY